MKWLALIFSLLFVAVWMGATRDTSIEVTRDQMGDKWPFVPDKVRLDCVRHRSSSGLIRPHVLVIHENQLYALNGTARGSGLYRDADEITRMASNGTRPSDGGLITQGLDICGPT